MIKQAIKYSLVGAGNTLLTFFVYVILTRLFNCPKGAANLVGYVAGVINSFVWNRLWTFRYSGAWLTSALRFFAVFGFCYLLQLAFVSYLNDGALVIDFHIIGIHLTSDQCNFVIGMVVYNVLFFLLSKFITFKEQKA
jgi:putative flippase GtrA